jgi:hypothetical protein
MPRNEHVLHHAQTESDVFDVTYARCGDDAIEKMIEEQIPKLMASLTPVAPDLSRGQLTIAFYEKVTSRKFFGMASSQEKQYWEQWHIRLIVNTHPAETSNLESDGEPGCLGSVDSVVFLGRGLLTLSVFVPCCTGFSQF